MHNVYMEQIKSAKIDLIKIIIFSRGESNIPPALTPVTEEGEPETTATFEGMGADDDTNDDSTGPAYDQSGSSSKYRERRFREPRHRDRVLSFLKEKEKRKQEGKTADDLDLFFASITKSVRNLPRHVQLRLKREILNTVTLAEEEQELLQTFPPTHGLGSPSTYRHGSSISGNSSQTDLSNLVPSEQWEDARLQPL